MNVAPPGAAVHCGGRAGDGADTTASSAHGRSAESVRGGGQSTPCRTPLATTGEVLTITLTASAGILGRARCGGRARGIGRTLHERAAVTPRDRQRAALP